MAPQPIRGFLATLHFGFHFHHGNTSLLLAVDVACIHARTHTRTLTHSILYILYSDDCPLMSSSQSNLSESYRDINKTHMAGKLTLTAHCCIPTPVNVQWHVPKCYTPKNAQEQEYDFIQHSQPRKCLDQYLLTHEKKHTVSLHICPSVSLHLQIKANKQSSLRFTLKVQEVFTL